MVELYTQLYTQSPKNGEIRSETQKTPACHAGGREFEPRQPRTAFLAIPSCTKACAFSTRFLFSEMACCQYSRAVTAGFI